MAEKLPNIKRQTSKGQVSGRVFLVKKTKQQTIVEAIKARLKELREKKKDKDSKD